jgi:hypothetical protein
MDNSFFRFLSNFNDARNLQNRKLSSFDYDMQIHLKPGEVYTCITNNKSGVDLGEDYSAYIVNCNNEVLVNISNNIAIAQFIDNMSTKQLKIELFGIFIDFYAELVQFKLVNNVNGNVYWSNPFLNSNYDIDETVRFRFKNYIDIDGTNYSNASIYQSIRLKCIKIRTNFTSNGQSYITFGGLKYSSRIIKTKSYELVFDMLNDFIYDRLQYLLTHDVVYLDGTRVTDKQTFESADKYSDTNIAQVKFRVSVDEEDKDNETYQVDSGQNSSSFNYFVFSNNLITFDSESDTFDFDII